ncbi:PLP-dependent transferase [Daedaleopsis nitida]|nr:PLP-dependent transferase [Daedaleopsis nitida]
MHNAIASWFLGPQAENKERLKTLFSRAVDDAAHARINYYEEDGPFVSQAMKESPEFTSNVAKLEKEFYYLSQLLNKYSVPFFSQRYAAHMCFETSMPAILGWILTILTNPNNVAFEASPLTTLLEIDVGRQLCEMLGYYAPTEPELGRQVAWGHIACDGTVANAESMWAARNLKFYPLSLRLAMEKDKILATAAATLMVHTCAEPDKEVLFSELDPWELLNLPTDVVLDLPAQLYLQCRISATYIGAALKDYLVQETGKDVLMQMFEETFKDKWTFKLKQPQYLISATRHYSWPKAAALTGIGASNMVNIAVDANARVKIEELDKQLQKRLDDGVPVYAVVAVIGTTEEGAVDPLEDILKLKEKFQKKGLSFVVHADAAWGGYFASMIRDPPGVARRAPTKGDRDHVFGFSLREHTVKQFHALAHTDSITIDPHKAGYIPYPAGGLCYKDGRMRQLVTWSAPYLNQGSKAESIGIYGIEGSKPGAPAAAIYLHHHVVGLHKEGHGALLGEVVWTSSRLSALWATMGDEESRFIVVPFNEVKKEDMEIIRTKIVGKDNKTVHDDPDARRVLRNLGSDLNINAFCVNFRVNGEVNDDVEEANILSSCIYKSLSIVDEPVDVKEMPMFISSTTFEMEAYDECATKFKERVGLETESRQDLFVMRNVVMSPFQSAGNFIDKVADIFKGEIEKKLDPFIERNTIKPSQLGFIVQGSGHKIGDKIHLVQMPNFYDANRRYQLILRADVIEINEDQEVEDDTTRIPTICVFKDTTIENIIAAKAIQATILEGWPTPWKVVTLSNIEVVKNRSLRSRYRDLTYPDYMHAYLYGTPEEPFIDHMLLRAPNWQITTQEKVDLKLDTALSADQLKTGVIVEFVDEPEAARQPFLEDDVKEVCDVGRAHRVKVYTDPHPATAHRAGPAQVGEKELIAQGTLAFTAGPWISDGLNEGRDPWEKGNNLVGGPMTIEKLLGTIPPKPELYAKKTGAVRKAKPSGAQVREDKWVDVLKGLSSFRK